MTSREPIISVIGVGVTGTRVATELAATGTMRIGVMDSRHDVAIVMARSIGGAAIDLDHAQFADVAVLALPTPHAALARRLLSNGVAVVSMSDDVDDVGDLLALGDLAAEAGLPLVIGAAMAPGLSGLLARVLADQLATVDEIHIAMHGTGGPACARQHHRALGGTSIGLHDGEWIKRQAGAGRELCWFPEPVNAYDCYRAEMPDPILLHRVFPEVERMTARMSANRRDRFTSRLPMLRPPHKEGGVGGVRVELRGGLADGARETLIAGTSVRSGIAAAAVAAAMTRWVLSCIGLPESTGETGGSSTRSGPDGSDPPAIVGPVVLGDPRLPTVEILEQISASGVPLSEFTGRARAAEG